MYHDLPDLATLHVTRKVCSYMNPMLPPKTNASTGIEVNKVIY